MLLLVVVRPEGGRGRAAPNADGRQYLTGAHDVRGGHHVLPALMLLGTALVVTATAYALLPRGLARRVAIDRLAGARARLALEGTRDDQWRVDRHSDQAAQKKASREDRMRGKLWQWIGNS